MRVQGNLSEFADRELRLAGYDSDSPEFVKSTVYRNVMDLIHTFEDQRHSGMSASWILAIFQTLAAFKPLGPLTGEDSEWVLVDESRGLYQNARCGRVIRENGVAYDTEGKVFKTCDGVTYTAPEGKVPVVFPYTPMTQIINVDE